MAKKQISSNNKKEKKLPNNPVLHNLAAVFLRKALPIATGFLMLFTSISFFIGTYDSAQVKLTLFHMGSTIILALWAALLTVEKRIPFNKKNLPFLLPFFAYLGWNLFSFLFLPYKWEAGEECIRFILYGGLMLMAACEFREKQIQTLTRFIILSAWISFSYGVLQVVDGFFAGADIMPWRGFFAKRVFSTHANPNFFGDFIVFSFFIILVRYLQTKQKNLLLLLGMGALSLFYTESKGAWIAFAATAVVFSGIYTNFFSQRLKNKRKLINISAVLLLIFAVALSGWYASKRFQSVSFRAHTWLATAQMIIDSPVKGFGLGSFKIIYPSYRRAQIFYIENAHNTETQHAENEYLEQWATAGTVGLAIFLWLIVFLVSATLRRLSERPDITPPSEKDWYLLGYSAALSGILVHAFFDISVRFVSTGLFFALFCGILTALFQPQETEPVADIPKKQNLFFLFSYLFLTAGIGILGILLCRRFAEVMSPLVFQTIGEIGVGICAWLVLLFSLLGTAFLFLRSAWLSRSACVSLIFLTALPLLSVFYGWFQANHYYSVAVSLLNQKNSEGAVGYFTKAIKFNPLMAEYRQFRGNVLASTRKENMFFSPDRGDTHSPSTDFERAQRDYQWVLKHAPNHALIHQNRGQLFYQDAVKNTQYHMRSKNQYERDLYYQKAKQSMEKAKKAFELSLKIDPVNPATYVYLTSIALMERNTQQAHMWVEKYRSAPSEITEEEFKKRHTNNPAFEQALRGLSSMRNIPPIQKR